GDRPRSRSGSGSGRLNHGRPAPRASRTGEGMNQRVRELLEGFPIVVPNPVAWADMDVFRHVNNAVFFRYFENARIRYLEAIGFGDDDRHSGLGPILHSTNARFRRPLRYPDTAW